MSRLVYTSITYDNDRTALEDFLRAANFTPVSIEIGDMSFFARAAKDHPEGIAVVSSLVNSRGINIDLAWQVWEEMEQGIAVSEAKLQKAEFPDLSEGMYGDRLATAMGKLAIPSLTVIFPSEYPHVRGEHIKFVRKEGWSQEGRAQGHSEIAGHLNAFFKAILPS